MNLQAGDVVVSTAGKEKNQFFVVKSLDAKFCYLVDGDRLKLEKPKKKSLKHVQKASKDVFDVAELQSENNDVNAHLRKFLKEKICQRKM